MAHTQQYKTLSYIDPETKAMSEMADWIDCGAPTFDIERAARDYIARRPGAIVYIYRDDSTHFCRVVRGGRVTIIDPLGIREFFRPDRLDPVRTIS